MAGVPVTTGLTGRVFDWSPLPTEIFTRTVLGSMLTGLRTSPRMSTATRSTVWSTSIPDGWMTTAARAAVAWRTTDSGPDTTAWSTDRTGSRISSPPGTWPWSTWIGTVFDTSGSSWTVMSGGS